MNFLIIEDEEDFVEDIKRRVSSICRSPQYTIAASKVSAVYLLEDNCFDLIFLDLKIPTEDSSMDSNPNNGRSVLDAIVALAPGTPVLILTGSSAEEFLPDILQLAHRVNIWGGGESLALIGLQKKHRLNQLDETIAPYIKACDAIFDVELQSADELSFQEGRLIRIFARYVDGVFCRVKKISGGLSGAKVYQLLVTGENGAKIHDAIAKLGDPVAINKEVDCYDRFIMRLDAGATPRKISVMQYGAKNMSGVFYSLANASERNMFSFFENGAGPVMEKLAGSVEKWQAAALQRRVRIGDIRRCFIDDEGFAPVRADISHGWVEAFENLEIQVNWGGVHGDLHGLNVLVSESGNPVLIDYGDVGEGASSQDPITLELSAIFHIDGPLKGRGWPSKETAMKWGKDAFIDEDCPASEFFGACRKWAEKVSVGKRERAAVAYGYLVRQLKYSDCNRELVDSLLMGVKNLYDEA